jgi:hypothetical protein
LIGPAIWQVVEYADALPRLDLVLMDIRLPYEDGYGALEKIRSSGHLKNTQLDAYFIYKRDEQVRSNGDNADIYTIGGKITGTLADHWQYSGEGAYQFGNKEDNVREQGAGNALVFADRDINAYAGIASGLLIRDGFEAGLINQGLPNYIEAGGNEIPLVIQDKTFVPEPAQLALEDPTWMTTVWGGQGNLWYPHVYMTNQNPWDVGGANAMGRWDYGPWFWPPFTGLAHGPIPNPTRQSSA